MAYSSYLPTLRVGLSISRRCVNPFVLRPSHLRLLHSSSARCSSSSSSSSSSSGYIDYSDEEHTPFITSEGEGKGEIPITRPDTWVPAVYVSKRSKQHFEEVYVDVEDHFNHPLFSVNQQLEALHLYRHLLREASYLPDPHARKYIAAHIGDRFRDHQLRQHSITLTYGRRPRAVQKARKALSEIYRANRGQLKLVAKVLHMTYGRTGKRRHELMAPLLKDDSILDGEPASVSVPEAASKQQKKKKNSEEEDATFAGLWPARFDAEAKHLELPKLTNKLKALLSSQMRSSVPEITRPNPRSLKPDIPSKNVWNRPLPMKRVKNLTKEWYATMLDRTLPPLETNAWEELRRRATGLLPYEPVVRRVKATPVLEPSRGYANSRDAILTQQLGLSDAKTPDEIYFMADQTARPRELNERFMQRRWAAVFAQCPKMEWDSASETWDIVWGSDVLDSELKQKTIAEIQKDDGHAKRDFRYRQKERMKALAMVEHQRLFPAIPIYYEPDKWSRGSTRAREEYNELVSYPPSSTRQEKEGAWATSESTREDGSVHYSPSSAFQTSHRST